MVNSCVIKWHDKLIKGYKGISSVTGFKTEIDDYLIHIGVSLIFEGEKVYKIIQGPEN